VAQLLALKLPTLEGVLLNCCSSEAIDAAMPTLAAATVGTGDSLCQAVFSRIDPCCLLPYAK
jgi:hypothetical protein